MKKLSYLSLFFIPALPLFAYWVGAETGWWNAAAFIPLIFNQFLLPLIDWLVADDEYNPGPQETESLIADRYYARVAMACAPIQIGLLAWSAYVLFVLQPFNLLGTIVWTMSIGHIGGIIAINSAHELIHRQSRLQRGVGGLLLSTVSYAGFKIEHVRGHHVHVSTPEDASSADYDQSLYHFLPRAFARNFVNAWKLEAKRLRQKGLSPLHYRNELIWWYALSLSFAVAFYLYAGWAGVLFFIAQSYFAAFTLEVINYVEHYGLRRKRLDNGRYERPDHRHSWNSNARVTNAILLQLARHSDHHENPTRPYQALRQYPESPQLPAGYAAMFMLAQVPPLWRKVMNPRVVRYLGEQPGSAA